MYHKDVNITYVVDDKKLINISQYPIAYVEGTGNYITSMMVLPWHQGEGIGKRLLHDYLELYSKDSDTFRFKTSRSFDSYYISKRMNVKDKRTTNCYSYSIECYKI